MRTTVLILGLLGVLALADVKNNIPITDMATSMPWSESAALEYYTYALAAFCMETELQGWTCPYCGQNGTAGFQPLAVFGDNGNSTFGYVGVGGSEIIVAFRGETGTALQTWISTLDSTPTLVDFPYVSGATVYEEFYETYLTMHTQMFGAIANVALKNPGLPIVLVGHTYGAAMATLAACELATRVPSANLNLWTYAAPRVGDATFAAGVAAAVQTSWRHTNGNDIVPHYPTQAAGYQHVATEYFFNNNVWTECDGSGEDASCSDQFTTNLSPYNTYGYFGVPWQCATVPPKPATSSSSTASSTGITTGGTWNSWSGGGTKTTTWSSGKSFTSQPTSSGGWSAAGTYSASGNTYSASTGGVSTAAPTTGQPTTAQPTSYAPTTAQPTSYAPTTAASTYAPSTGGSTGGSTYPYSTYYYSSYYGSSYYGSSWGDAGKRGGAGVGVRGGKPRARAHPKTPMRLGN